jgi:hypothetical protein
MLLVSLLLSCQTDVHGPAPKDDAAAAFALTGLAPSQGPAAGGTSVSVRGAGFTDATTATVGGAPCVSLTWLSDTELLCVTPAGAPGEALLAVTEGDASGTLPFTFVGGEDTGGDDTGGDTAADTGSGDTAGDTDSGDTAGDTDTAADTDSGDTDSGGDTDTDPGPTVPVDYCHLQYPCTMASIAGTTSDTVYGWVYQGGATEGAGAGAGLRLEVGVGPDGGDPATGSGWSWAAMAYNEDKDGLVPGDLANDEYMGSFPVPSTAGVYDYCVRASADGGASWTYCDGGGGTCPGGGSDDGYSAADAGQLTVP